MKSIKLYAGPLWPVFCALLINLLLLSISRFALSLWQWNRIEEAEGWGAVLLQGLRIDISTVCLVFGITALLTIFISGAHFMGRLWMKILRIWLVMITVLLVFMELSTPAFIQTYDLRPNRLFFEYLLYPKEVFSMLLGGHLLALIMTLSATLIIAWVAWSKSARLFNELYYPKWYYRPIIGFVILITAVMGARSTLGHRPINPAMVAFSTDSLVNSLVLNSSYSLGFAIYQLSKEENSASIYGKLPEKEIITRIREAQGRPLSEYSSDVIPTLTKNTASYQGKRKNLVIILEESLGARFVGSLGGKQLTPNLDRLAKEGWFFKQLYATGTRSVRGIEAVVSGFTPTPARSVVKLDKSQTGFFTLAQLLVRNGYSTQFIYGGEKHFDNMGSFFLGNGFQQIIEEKDYLNPVFKGSWGVSDEDVLRRADVEFERQQQSGKPFFSLVFSSSNHDPYEYPDSKIERYDKAKKTVNNAVKYADYSLGLFFDLAKKSSYWKDTIFLVVADHDARVFGADLVPINNFRIPGLILGEGITPNVDSTIASQIDLAPTLLSLMGIDSENPMLGHDLTQRKESDKGRAFMQYDKNFAYMEGNQVVVLQPEHEASSYRYSNKRKELIVADVSSKLKDQALAYVLWGSLAYRKKLYRLPKNRK